MPDCEGTELIAIFSDINSYVTRRINRKVVSLMKKITKIISLFLVCLCCVLQFCAYSSAATTAKYDVFLRNFQEKQTFASGENDTAIPNTSYITFTSGTANYIYVQVQNSSGVAVSSDWKKISNGTTAYVELPHLVSISSGATLKIVGYQKNIDYKSAKGDIIF
ncbi:hypothetical protein J6Q66_01205 [bacterium]|nr:hypothetical protein [bacterium]